MWDPQVPALAERYRVVTYDTRGHGESPAPAGPYSLDDLVDDLVALLDEVGVDAGARRRAVAGRHDRDAAGRPRARPGRPAGAAVHLGEAGSAGRSSTGRPPSAPGAPRRSPRPSPPLADARLRRRAPRPGRAARGDDRRGGRRGLRRLLRGRRPAWTCATDLGADHRADAGGRGRRRPRPAAGAPAADRRRHPRRRTAHRQPRRPPGQPGAAAGGHRRAARPLRRRGGTR